MFTSEFESFVCEGDTITCTVDGLTATARIVHDDNSEAPDKRRDGFWPSLEPSDAGYIGSKSERTLARRMAEARAVMAAWQIGEWYYCGICVTITKGNVPLTGPYDHALWGVECNCPAKRPNLYLREVANGLLDGALDAARVKVDLILSQWTQIES